MNTNLEIVLEAAEMRRDQWQQAANKGTPENVIEELWESGHDECQTMADILTGAIDAVRKENKS